MTGETTSLGNALVHADETVDDLRAGGLRIIQGRDGYRFSLDPVLLSAFARVPEAARVLDLGTGCGVIPLLLARQVPSAEVVGLELQAQLADRARRSVLLNGLADRVRIVEGDLRDASTLFAPESFDLVTANPPFRTVGSGRISPGDERAAARHELAGSLVDFLRAAAYLLPTGGSLSMVFLAERLAELLAELRCFRLEPKRLRLVHSRAGDPARLVLVESRRNGRTGLEVEPPLYVYAGNDYTEEVHRIYGAPAFESRE